MSDRVTRNSDSYGIVVVFLKKTSTTHKQLISHVYEITTYFVDTHILYIQVKEKAFKINAKNKLTEH